MKLFSTYLKSAMIAVLMIFFTGCEKDELNEQLFEADAKAEVPTAEAKAPAAEEDAAGNNLSFPVFWAEGIAKDLRIPPSEPWPFGDVLLEGEWWFVWGEDPLDPTYPIYSCEPSLSGELLCADDRTVPGADYYKAWLQKEPLNFWEAFNGDATLPVNLDFIDWGDNLESIDWRINSKVRTELVLYENVAGQDFIDGVLQYPMRHVDGWGITEVHGLQTNLDGVIYEPTFEEDPTFGMRATVYSERTRMTIQKLNVDRDDPRLLTQLDWDAANSKWIDIEEDDVLLINEPFFNYAVADAADGPGYFNAEVNVKGKIIYGYTWDMKAMNEGTGDYRITYSFDGDITTGLNTFITDATQIIVAEEVVEEEVTIAAEGESGGVGVRDSGNNLTYMDIRIVGKTTGGGGGNSGGNGGGNSGGAGNSGGNGGGDNSGGGGNGNGGGRN